MRPAHTSHLRTFYILVITQTLSIIGSRMTALAIGIRVFDETGQAAPLLLVAFFNELPAMLANSVVGVWIDRWDRRWVMMLADAGQALGSVLLLLSFVSGNFQLWHLYAVALTQGIFAMFQSPAKDAVVTMLVPNEQRDRANAVQAMAFPLAGVVAPALTGLLYVIVGLVGIVLIDLLTFFSSIVAVYRMHIPRPEQSVEALSSGGHFWDDLASGFRYVCARPGLLGLMLYATILNFLLNGPLELSIPYLITITGSKAVTGMVLAASSLGGFIGAGVLALYSGRLHTRIGPILIASTVVGMMFLVHGSTRSPLLLGLSIFILIAALQVGALYTSILQVKTPPDLQGRVFSISAQLGYLASTTSFLLTGPLVDRILEPAVATPAWSAVAGVVGNQPGAGMGLVLVVTGVLILLTTLVAWALPALRRIEATLPDYEAVPASQ
jgi:MFS family permease